MSKIPIHKHTPVSDQQRDKEKATEAIMKLVASKVPKGWKPDKGLFAEEKAIQYGYNLCRREILDNLGVEE